MQDRAYNEEHKHCITQPFDTACGGHKGSNLWIGGHLSPLAPPLRNWQHASDYAYELKLTVFCQPRTSLRGLCTALTTPWHFWRTWHCTSLPQTCGHWIVSQHEASRSSVSITRPYSTLRRRRLTAVWPVCSSIVNDEAIEQGHGRLHACVKTSTQHSEH